MFFKKKVDIGENNIANVVSGEVKDISNSPDEAFSSKVLGDGYVVFPSGNGDILSPISGEIALIHDALHSFVIKNKNYEVLVHVGIDTVNLKGEGFKAVKKQGAKVSAKDKILEVDFEAIKSKVPSIATMVVITNLSEDKKLEVKSGNHEKGDIVMEVKNK